MSFPAALCVGLAALVGGALFPSPEDEKLERERKVAEEISHTLMLVPGVTAARVHVQLAERGLLVRSAARPGAVAVVRVDSREPDEGILRGIVQSAAPFAAPEDVRVIVVPEKAAAPPAVVRVGPFEVAAGSAGALRAAFAAALALVALLSTGLILAGLRLRRLRGQGG
jgi:type III secretory pathway lipoprotein EscJ